MASELRVNTLKDASGNNSIATSFVFGGTIKLWSQFSGISASLKDSFNVSTLTDNATGRFTNNFTTNMGSANYCVTAAASYSSQSGGNTSMSAEHDDSDYGRTTSAITTECAYDSSSADRTLYDYGDQNVKVAGDLA